MATIEFEEGDLVEASNMVGVIKKCFTRKVQRPHPWGGTFEFQQGVVMIDVTQCRPHGKFVKEITCDTRFCRLILKSFDRVLTSVETSD